MSNTLPQRRPAAVYSVGEEPDVRFSLANERTALAWVRTALALIAGGITLTTVAGLTSSPMVVHLLSLVACVAGGALAIVALLSWRRNEWALRLGLPLPPPLPLPWLVMGIAVVAAGLVGFGVVSILRLS
ncbi:YidH family protein [Gordonia sp. LUNF6]|uniref:YidH family protein n=1 Tax=Gordonia sp. LUNF6 TaxID=3388658 RepID=UPI00399B1BD2